ncbi:MAG: glycoside hydrolase [Vulcanisaeta sp. AZ3]
MIELTTDKALYEPGEDIAINITVGSITNKEEIKLTVIRDSNEVIRRELQALPPKSSILEHIKLNETGVYEIHAECCGLSATAPLMIVEKPESPVKFIIVFHNHQPINKYPNGHYHGHWAFHHTWFPEFQPIYDVGPYLLHARLVNKYKVPITYNLSPSLLWQWDDIINNGAFIEGDEFITHISPQNPNISLIKETLNTYSKLAKEGVIEVLTSFLAHPIAGYLIEKYNIDDVLKWELRVGKKVTKRILDVDATGVWLPELYFSERLRDILCSEGIRFTVLDGVYHLGESIKDRSSMYKIYKHDCLTIFFRDTALSDLLSFQLNKAGNTQEADTNARRLLIEVMLRAPYAKDGVITMALDGENWMILPTPNPYAALLLEKILNYLSKAMTDGYITPIRPSTLLGEAKEEIKEIPTTTWLGSPSKWLNERADIQSRLWSMAQIAINKWRIYEEVFGEDDNLRMSLAMTLDSDYYWAEFVNTDHISEWAFNTTRIVDEALSSLTVKIIREDDLLEIAVNNEWTRDATLLISVEVPESSMEHGIRIPSHSTESLGVERLNNVNISLLTPRSKTPIMKPIRITNTTI